MLGEFKSVNDRVEVRCTRCKNPFMFDYGEFRYNHKNQEIICPTCRRIVMGVNPGGMNSIGTRKRFHQYWNMYVKEFFSIPRCDWKDYRSHHILRYTLNEDYQTSICNGFPLKKELHEGFNAFYHFEEGTDINSWGDKERLSYHTYANFKFLDLNAKCITELIYPDASMGMQDLFKRKKFFAEDGKLYIPIFLNEMETEAKRNLVYSMLRNRLYKWFPEIYAYTGTKLNKFYARKLEVFHPDRKVAISFFELNHVQGAIDSSIYLGLKDSAGTLLACMSFSKQRFKTKGESYDYELTRFATLFDASVVGGASKLFKAFIKEFDPGSIVSYCDIRFSSFDPTETVYPKLGFTFTGKTNPNYWYRDPNTHILYNRLSFQKHKLKDKLEQFDPDLTEFENMEMNGYVRQVDCGNYKYVWRKSD